MQALFIVVHNPDRLQDVLVGLVEIGITTATVLESQGMGSIVSSSISVFAGFRDLWAGSGAYNHTIFAIIPDDQVEEALRVVKDVMAEVPEKGRGVAFTIPVSRFEKLSPDTEEPG